MGKNIGKERPSFIKDLVTEKNTHEHEYKYEYEHEYVPQRKPRRDRKINMLMNGETVEALDRYAKAHDVSRTEIIHSLVDKFLAENK